MTQSAQTLQDPGQAVSAGNRKLGEGLAARDAAALAACYTHDGEVLPPGQEAARGREAIRAFWQGAMDNLGVGEIMLESAEVERLGEDLLEVGHYRLRSTEGAEMDRGKYLVIWRLEDGEWRLHRDIFNSSVPQG